jgi:hypothetical protein
VRHLFQVHRDPGSILDRPAAVGVTGPFGPDPAAGVTPGRAMGPYTLVRQIGEGGMGTVFLAEHSGRCDRRLR